MASRNLTKKAVQRTLTQRFGRPPNEEEVQEYLAEERGKTRNNRQSSVLKKKPRRARMVSSR